MPSMTCARCAPLLAAIEPLLPTTFAFAGLMYLWPGNAYVLPQDRGNRR